MIAVIAAIDSRLGIGLNGQIPWHLKQDMEHFKKLTMGDIVIMGKLTFESMKSKPLKNRMNIVITNSYSASKINELEEAYSNLYFFTNIEEAYEFAIQNLKSSLRDSNYRNIWFIGGKQVYEFGLKKADCLYLTRINRVYTCDVRFPDFNNYELSIESGWIFDETIDSHYQFQVYLNKSSS